MCTGHGLNPASVCVSRPAVVKRKQRRSKCGLSAKSVTKRENAGSGHGSGRCDMLTSGPASIGAMNSQTPSLQSSRICNSGIRAVRCASWLPQKASSSRLEPHPQGPACAGKPTPDVKESGKIRENKSCCHGLGDG